MIRSTKPTNPAIKKAIEIVGGRQILADKLGCHLNSVKNWLYKKSMVSLDSAININVVTRGKVTIEEIMEGFEEDE